ncbi:MAG: hypothetical protein HQK87_11120, partial [Nitrospinae bacterium]|nr:hypothetical protein [Nitrospinota bacterium]
LATLFPAHLGPKADPFDTPAHIKPEWYFLAAFYSLKLAEYTEFLGLWAPKIIGIAGQGVAVGILFLVPWLDRGEVKVRDWRKRPKAMIGLAVGLGSFIILTLMGHFS